MQTQIELLKSMEIDFQIVRPVFVNHFRRK